VDDLLTQARQGRRRAIARLMTLIENDQTAAHQAITALHPYTGKAHIVGITGSPGSGKSTLVNELAKALRRRGGQVGVIAVDPTSPFTGGALLGDRVRMRDLSGDDGIFIRSMASRGNLGGLAQMTGAMAKVLDAAGFETILIETVGAGQAEVEIAGAAHTTLVIEAPGMGDEIQSNKAGILEIADILVVNKADQPTAVNTVKALKLMLHLGMRHESENGAEPAWETPVLEAVAVEGKGIEEIVTAVARHKETLQSSSGWHKKEAERSRQEIAHLLQTRFMARLQQSVPQAEYERLVTAVAQREMDAYTAVDQLLAVMSEK
jgi:LAO/AO transport system kinase